MEKETFHQLKLLYIEDDPDTLATVTRFLRRRFSRVLTAATGKDGFTLFEEFVPDIIIIDLLLPDISGLELLGRIRQAGFQTPVIITSALQDSASILKTIDLEITKYVVKPVDLFALAESLDRLAERLTSKTKPLDFSAEHLAELERRIKIAISALLKHTTGKGPKDIQVFIAHQQIEIICRQVLTPMELTLLTKGHSPQLVKQSRQLYYQAVEKEIIETLGDILEVKVELRQCQCDIQNNRDQLVAVYT